MCVVGKLFGVVQPGFLVGTRVSCFCYAPAMYLVLGGVITDKQ